MNPSPQNGEISVFIVDDEQYSIDILKQELKTIDDVKVIGSETHFVRAQKKIRALKPDLIFLDIEMPCKSGFEMLHDIKKQVSFEFQVIFYTAFDKYAIQALKESALDYILKPVHRDELKEAINRLKKQKTRIPEGFLEHNKLYPDPGGVISVPTFTGIKFMKCNEIVIAQFARDKRMSKGHWLILSYKNEVIKLRNGLNARNVVDILGCNSFVQLNQSAIVNLNYINAIEIKTKRCVLIPPFQKTEIQVSRNYLSLLRNRFENF